MPTLPETTALRLTTQPQTQPDMWLVQTEADGIAFVNEHTEDAFCPPYSLVCIQTKDCGPFDAAIDFDEHWVLMVMVTRKPTAEECTTQTRIENWVLNHPTLKGVLSDWYTVPADQTARAENNYKDEI